MLIWMPHQSLLSFLSARSVPVGAQRPDADTQSSNHYQMMQQEGKFSFKLHPDRIWCAGSLISAEPAAFHSVEIFRMDILCACLRPGEKGRANSGHVSARIHSLCRSSQPSYESVNQLVISVSPGLLRTGKREWDPSPRRRRLSCGRPSLCFRVMG